MSFLEKASIFLRHLYLSRMEVRKGEDESE